MGSCDHDGRPFGCPICVVQIVVHVVSDSGRRLLEPHVSSDDLLIRVTVNPTNKERASVAARVTPRAPDASSLDFVLHLLNPGVRGVHVDIIVAGTPIWWGPFQLLAGPSTAGFTGRGSEHPAAKDLGSDGIATSPDGTLVVCSSTAHHHLKVYNLLSGQLMRRVGGPFASAKEGMFHHPRGLCFARWGEWTVGPVPLVVWLWVLLTHVRWLASGLYAPCPLSCSVLGSPAPRPPRPCVSHRQSSSSVLVADATNNRVQEVTMQDRFVRCIGAGVLESPWGVAASTEHIVVRALPVSPQPCPAQAELT